MNPTRSEEFIKDLHRVLQALYDPTELRKSSLVGLFDLGKRSNSALALQDTLRNAIHLLRPGSTVPAQSNAWRLYNVLVYRFLEQTSQAMVADALGLSVRQLRRGENEAVRILAEVLWKKYNLEDPIVSDDSKITSSTPYPNTPGHEEELEWLLKSFPSGTTSFSELIDPALKAVQPLMQNLGKRIECQIPDDLPAVNGHLTAMRQAIMNILLAGLPVIPAEVLIVQVSAQSQEIFVQLHSAPSTLLQEESCNPELVGMAEKFSNLFNGRLEIHANPFSAQLILPVVQQIPIVVIDDNTDVLHLLQRYVTGSAFRFYGFSQPGLAIEEVMEIDPQVIVMDVMMPGMDDWELLGRLRSHPATSAIPIIVCTILPQDQLAFTLGASGFLRKPVSRQAFLAELERLTIHASPKPS